MRWSRLVLSATLLAVVMLAPAPFAQVRPPVVEPRSGPSRIPEGILSGPRVKSISVASHARCCMADAQQTHCLTPIVSVTPRLDRGTARILPSARPETPSPYYAITSADRQVLTPDNVILFENTATPRVMTVVKPMWCRLECTLTAVNDHGIVLALREIVLDGPPGLTFP